MGRPRKNGVEPLLNIEGDKLHMGNENARQNTNNATEHEQNEQILPIEVESYAMLPLENPDRKSFLMEAPNDIEVRQGRMEIITGIVIKDGYFGLIFPLHDNAAKGLPTEKGYRLQHSDVISMTAQKKVKLMLNINDETMVQEHTNHGSRYRSLVIPKGTPLAELVIFKL